LGGEKLGDTRQMTSHVRKTAPKAAARRASTMKKTVEEAKAVYGSVGTPDKRKTRKRAAPAPASASKAKKPRTKAPKARALKAKTPTKAPLKKAGTMVNTAKEGKAFLKRRGGK